MRTTVNMDEHVLARAKDLARERGTTLGKVLEAGVLAQLDRADEPLPPIPIFRGGTGMNPEAPLHSNAALEEWLDEQDAKAR